jgi:hypothetical protein
MLSYFVRSLSIMHRELPTESSITVPHHWSRMTRHLLFRLDLGISDLVSSIALSIYRRDNIPHLHLNPSDQLLYLAVCRLQCYIGQTTKETKRLIYPDAITISLQCQQDPTPPHRVFTRSRANLTTRVKFNFTTC